MSWYDRSYARPEVHQPYRPRSVFGGSRWSMTTIIIVVNLGLWIVPAMLGRGGLWIYEWGAMTAGLVMKGQIWRLLTATYLHDPASWMHVGFNMLGLYFFGRPVEARWGPKKFFAVYTVCGLTGTLLYLVLSITGAFNFDTHTFLLGASGCVLGMLGSCAILFPHFDVYIMGLLPVPIRTVAIVYALFWGVNVWNQGPNAGGDVAHLAGLGFGALWAWRGDRWWRKWRGAPGLPRPGGLRLPRIFSWFSRTPTTPKNSWQESIRIAREDQELVDRVLDKVRREGIHSLTKAEKQALQEATTRQRGPDRGY